MSSDASIKTKTVKQPAVKEEGGCEEIGEQPLPLLDNPKKADVVPLAKQVINQLKFQMIPYMLLEGVRDQQQRFGYLKELVL